VSLIVEVQDLDCRVFYHDNCFDGACSASLFTRFHRECIGTAQSFDYVGMKHKAGLLYDESEFLSDGENAIVDFKYSASTRVTWWFDHHKSAFGSTEDEAHFRTGQRNADGTPGTQAMRQFFDPDYTSCTTWIAHIASTKFGMDVAPLKELLYWADIVDGAKYESAKAAVEMEAPAMKITSVIESAPSSALVQRFIPLMTSMSLEQIVAQPFVQQRLGPLMDEHWRGVDLIRERAALAHGVLSFDITDQPTEGYNKFIPYYLHPEATYCVGLSKSSFRTKISVGTNPWTKKPASELADIAAICERWGGGGHARVGAISFKVDEQAKARQAADVIVRELQSAWPA
jgi:hypothetical protein